MAKPITKETDNELIEGITMVEVLQKTELGIGFVVLPNVKDLVIKGLDASRIHLVSMLNNSNTAKKKNKEFKRYFITAKAKSFLNQLSIRSGIKQEALVGWETRGLYQGVYCHPFVAIHFAQWYSDDFAIYCASIVYSHFAGGQHTQEGVVKGAADLQQQVRDLEEELKSKAEEITHLEADMARMISTMTASDNRLKTVKTSLELLESGTPVDLRSLIVELDAIQGTLIKES